MDIFIGVGFALLFSTLISFIEVMYHSKSKWKACLTGSFFIYWLILGTGNAATTLLAVSPVQRLFSSSSNNSESVTKSAQTASPSTDFDTLFNKVPELSGAIWFWYAFIGVFGFEILLKNINLTFANKGVLSINDWINKALDNATAAAIEFQTNSDTQQAQILANQLRTIPEPELKAQVLNLLGQDRLQELKKAIQQNGTDPSLTMALALAYEVPEQAEAISVSGSGVE